MLDLPVELQLEITAYLTFPERQLLRFTCTHFFSLLPAPTTPLELSLLEVSIYNARTLLACQGACFKFLPDELWHMGHPHGTVHAKCSKCNFIREWFFRDQDLPGKWLTLRWEEERECLRELRKRQGLETAWWDYKEGEKEDGYNLAGRGMWYWKETKQKTTLPMFFRGMTDNVGYGRGGLGLGIVSRPATL